MAEQQEVPNYLETPEGRRLAYFKIDGSSPGAVYIHGLKSNMTGVKARAFEDCCKAQGKAFVRFDLSGHGRSSEAFAECNMSMWLEDLNAVLASLTTGPQVLVGSSIGGWLMFLYTMRNPEKVCGLIGISAAPDFTANLWRSLDKDTQKQVKRSGVYKLPYPEPYEISMQFIHDGDKYSILEMPGMPVFVWGVEGGRGVMCPIITVVPRVMKIIPVKDTRAHLETHTCIPHMHTHMHTHKHMLKDQNLLSWYLFCPHWNRAVL